MSESLAHAHRTERRMYPYEIPGLTFVPMNHDPTRLRAALSSETSRETVERLVRELPPGKMLQFYDPHSPSPSDPGAHVWIRRTGGTYRFGIGNHGWTAGPWSTTADEMIDRLFQLRAANSDLARGDCIEVSDDL